VARGQLWAHVERVGHCEGKCSGLIRIFEDGQEWGDPYRYVFPFRMIDEKTIELYGVIGRAPTIGEVRAMAEACRARGWRVVFQRQCGVKPGLHEQE